MKKGNGWGMGDCVIKLWNDGAAVKREKNPENKIINKVKMTSVWYLEFDYDNVYNSTF